MLGCLVASMTTGAVFLHWCQPTRLRPVPESAIELIANAINQPWSQVQVDPARLDGRINETETHFFIDREGRWSATNSWKSQSTIAGQRQGVIRISLQPSPNTNKLTPAQWDTTQRLVRELVKQCGITSPVSYHDTLAIPALTQTPSSAARRQTVGQAGITGRH